MAKIFYDHLVVHEEITAELDKYNIRVEEKEELIQLVDQTLHHHVLDVILTHLPKEKHEEFLTKFHKAPHDESLLDYIKDFEEEIIKEAKKVKLELLAEIKKFAAGQARRKKR